MTQSYLYVRLLSLLGFVLSIGCITIFPIDPVDIFSSLIYGRQWADGELFKFMILDSSTLSTHDIVFQWLTYCLYYIAYLIAGLQGVILFKWCIIASIGVGTALIFWDRLFVFVLYQGLYLIALITGVHHLVPTASLFTDLFLLGVIASASLFFLGRLSIRSLFIFLVGMTIVWVNLHPGFVFGVGACWALGGIAYGCYRHDGLMRDFTRIWVAISVWVVLATCVNPRGVYVWAYLRSFIESFSFFNSVNWKWKQVVVLFLEHPLVFTGIGFFFIFYCGMLVVLYRYWIYISKRIRCLYIFFSCLSFCVLAMSLMSWQFVLTWLIFQPFICVFGVYYLSFPEKPLVLTRQYAYGAIVSFGIGVICICGMRIYMPIF